MAGSTDFPIPDSNSAAILNSDDVRHELMEILAPIYKKIDEGKSLTSNEVVQYNQALRNTIVSQFTKVANIISNKVEIKSGDSPGITKTKIAAGKVIHNYLSTVTDWLMKAVETAYKKFIEGAQWCYELLKGTLQKIYDTWFGN